jgi:hypothetical protein
VLPALWNDRCKCADFAPQHFHLDIVWRKLKNLSERVAVDDILIVDQKILKVWWLNHIAQWNLE